jgi:PhnB protein
MGLFIWEVIMSLDPFFYFDGECQEALQFYREVFKVEGKHDVMRYGDNPAADVPEEGRNRVMYSSLPIFEHNIMMADVPLGSPFQKGGNVALTLGSPDKTEIERLFNALADGGQIDMPLGNTFFSELYGMVTDRFGIRWQLSATAFEE